MQEGEHEEVDTSGACDVKYVLGDANRVVKFKTNCRAPSESVFLKHTNQVSEFFNPLLASVQCMGRLVKILDFDLGRDHLKKNRMSVAILSR